MDKLATICPAYADAIHIVQITDTHIYADDTGIFKGIDTQTSLAGVVHAICRLPQAPDAVLLTGDLAHDPVPDAYRSLAGLLHEIPAPVFCLPGNHDDPELMQAELNSGNVSTAKQIDCGLWRILMLDTHLPGSHGGCLAPEELAFLRRSLLQDAASHLLIALHHHPVAIASAWMDDMMLENADAFWTLADHHNRLRGVLWGHIHQFYHGRRNKVALFGTPSTCVQFRPGTAAPVMDELSPAFRQFVLYPDGMIETKVRWVEAVHN
jgi:Icc protein